MNLENSMNTDLNELIVVCGGGGFIGGHLVGDLVRQGHQQIRAVDLKPLNEWYQRFPDVENLQLDLQDKQACETAVRGAAVVFNLAADMGGMGFIENNRALCMLSVLINTHLLMAAREFGVRRFFFSSSACVYAADKQISENVVAAQGKRCVSGHAGGRIRVGEAFQRAHVPAFPRGFRRPNTRRALP